MFLVELLQWKIKTPINPSKNMSNPERQIIVDNSETSYRRDEINLQP